MNVKDQFDLAGRVAVITGGAGLLGVQHAEAIAEMGGIPILADVDARRAAAVAKLIAARFGVAATGHGVDITRPASVKKLCGTLLRQHGRVDILINNAARNPKVEGAGKLAWSRLENYPLPQWEQDLAVGLTGALICSQIFGAEMARAGRGVILNVASDLGVIAPDQRIYRRPGVPADRQPVKPVSYSVVKHGLIGLTKYLATYWAEQGVRANAISPGGVFNEQDRDFVRRLTALIPLGRMARLGEYKAAVVFLVSDASQYMTGANLVMDGPQHMVKTIKLLALDIDGVLTDGRTTLGARPPEKKRLAFQDLDALNAARRAGLQIALVTGESDGSVDLVAARTGVTMVRRGAKDKLAALQSVAKEARVLLAEICYVGDGDRDAPALARIGWALAPANATFAARSAAHRVLDKSGGHGAVNEAVRLLLNLLADGRHEKIIRRHVRGNFQKQKIPLHQIHTAVRLAQELARAFQLDGKILLCGGKADSAMRALSSSKLAWPVLELSRDRAMRAKQTLAVARPGDLVVYVGGVETDSGHHPVPAKIPDVLGLAIHGRQNGAWWHAVVEAAEAILIPGPA